MHYDFAPLEGITGWVLRGVHRRHFPEADRYFTPFAVANQTRNFKTKEWEDLDPRHNEGVPVIPQILANRADEFLWAAGEIRALGYPEVNLNLGCPVPMIARKHKGSGMLADPEELDRLLDGIFEGLAKADGPRLSVKTRLGTEDFGKTDRLMEIYRKYPLTDLIIHPRTQRDMYRVPADPAMFSRALLSYGRAQGACKPADLYYNGDLRTAADCAGIRERFPAIAGVMLGRGLLADPALIREAGGGAPLGREELRDYHSDLLQAMRETLPGDAVTIGRMKELWLYLGENFPGGDRYLKEIRKAGNMTAYEAAVRSLFVNVPFRAAGSVFPQV